MLCHILISCTPEACDMRHTCLARSVISIACVGLQSVCRLTPYFKQGSCLRHCVHDAYGVQFGAADQFANATDKGAEQGT